MRIRVAREEDLKEVFALERLCFGSEAFSFDLIAYFFRTLRELFLVVEESGEVVGYAVGRVGGGVGEVLSIAIRPDRQGRGYGSDLLKALLKELSKRGAKKAVLQVKVSNQKAMKLYEKFGFKVKGVISGYYPDGSDAYLMEAELD